MKSCKNIHSPFFILLLFNALISCEDKKLSSIPSERVSDSLYIKAYHTLQKGDSLYMLRTNLDSAFSYYNESKIVFLKKQDSIRAGYTLLKMAQIQHASADYFGSEESATEALKYLNNKSPLSVDYLTETYNLLGMDNWKLYNYSDAIKYYNQAYIMSKDTLDKNAISNNIASIYIDQKKYDVALSVLKKLENSNSLSNDLSTKARVLNNIGHIYSKLENKEAIDYLNASLALRLELKNSIDITRSHLQLTEYFIGKNKNKAFYHATKAYYFSQKANTPNERLKSLNKLIFLSSDKEAKEYTYKYISLQDSIDKVKMIAKSQFAKIKYDSKTIQKEKERLEVLKEKNLLIIQKKQAQNQLLLASVAFLVFLIIISYKLLKIRHKQEKLKEVYKTEDRISKKIHDELANDIFRVITQTENLQIDSEQKNRLISELDTAYNKARNISRETSAIEGGEYSQLLRELLAEYNTLERKIVIVNLRAINWDKVSKLKKTALFRVLQELMINMAKHSKAKRVVIRFQKNRKDISINYFDDGIGLVKEKFKSNGLYNAETRILSIGGRIIFENMTKNGLKININIPV